MGTLSDNINNELAEFRKGPRCSMAIFIEKLPDTDRAALEAALSDLTIPTSLIARAVFRTPDNKVAKTAVSHHRKGSCSCSPTEPAAKAPAKKR